MANVNPDSGNPCLASISQPNAGNGMIDQTAQNIKLSVQDLRRALVNRLGLAANFPGTNGGWKFPVRLVRHGGSNKTAGTVANQGGYTAINTLNPKSSAGGLQVDATAQIIKRAMLSHAKFMIEQEKNAGNLNGAWRAVVRIAPFNGNQQYAAGCGCGCS